ncbi:hypothetical protein K1719_013842 [Acacia pycnantha]|nr:hypothetical protein K1719_013842 [Acacia pycnantha]
MYCGFKLFEDFMAVIIDKRRKQGSHVLHGMLLKITCSGTSRNFNLWFLPSITLSSGLSGVQILYFGYWWGAGRFIWSPNHLVRLFPEKL